MSKLEIVVRIWIFPDGDTALMEPATLFVTRPVELQSSKR